MTRRSHRIRPVFVGIVVLAVGAAVATAGVTPRPVSARSDIALPAPPVTKMVVARSDAAVSRAHPNTNYGRAHWLAVSTSPLRRSYYKFAVVVPPGRMVTKALFQCYANTGNSTGAQLRSVLGSWTETTITWNRQPRLSTTLAGRTGRITARWYTHASADVTAAVKAGRYEFMAATTSGTAFACASRESATLRPPRLVITTAAIPPQPVTGTVDAIGDGGPDTAHWTAPLAAAIAADDPAVLLWAGDVRLTGTVAEWRRYDDLYGTLKAVTLPTPGNHDWGSAATGYDWEFGTGAAFADIDTYCNGITLANGWGLFSINSYTLASCLPELTAFLATPGTRKIVVTHLPRWSGGSHGSPTAQSPIWNAMKGHAFALVSGHDHDSQIIERDGLVQVVNGCAGADYYNVTPIAGEVYYSTNAADCTYHRFLLGTNTVTLQAVHADGSIDFSKTYAVTP